MVNCPAIPEHLLESELFGHRRGAFTGADRNHAGLFKEADGGTICLDEIGDIPVQIQIKLLRVLQEQEIKPIGANTAQKVNVRVVAMTNQDLEAKIAAHGFREDLFHRLNVVTLRTPTLKELRDDIPLLANHFAFQVCCELSLQEKKLSASSLELLSRKKWPGNVRELQNVIRQGVLFCRGDTIEPDDFELPDRGEKIMPATDKGRLCFDVTTAELYKEAKERIISEFTDHYIRQLLEQTGGNVTKAATISGLTRAALQKILRREEIDPRAFRE
jgi:DNA-binding NtrC family response regulator